MSMYLNALGMVCALGSTHAQITHRLVHGISGLDITDRFSPGRDLALGYVPLAETALPDVHFLPLEEQSRNNQMALAALAQIKDQVDAAIATYGADRIGVIIGTSTSGIAESENAFFALQAQGYFPAHFHYGQQELGSPAKAIAIALGVTGPAYVHSTACSSSSKALASAARLIKMGLCDAVVCGGVDTLCAFTIAGFQALESVSAMPCNPLSANRSGINIGEGAALFLMSKEKATVALLGWGESSDGHHISAPDPTGAGAHKAITQALQRANTAAHDLDYINLHGTATVQNDAMELNTVHQLCGDRVFVSSTKPMTGHTLGAAGAIEAGICWLIMQDNNTHGALPVHMWDGVPDPHLPSAKIVRMQDRLGYVPRRVLSNSFAFGGSNAALVLGRE